MSQPPFLPKTYSNLPPRETQRLCVCGTSKRKGTSGTHTSPPHPHVKKIFWGRNHLQGASHNQRKRGEEVEKQLCPQSELLKHPGEKV